MKKEEISYAVIGVVMGLVFGFFVANWTAGSGKGGQASAGGAEPQASVNSSSQTQQLPPGHPPVDPSQPTQAGPLPAGAGESGAGEMAAKPSTAASSAPASSAAPSDFEELPSLDPLPAASREKRAEQEYKNIQLLKGLPAERLMKVMFAFKSSLGVDCTHCHIKDQWEKDDKATKQMARKMITLTRDANARLGGAARVTCYTCHRGQARPPA